MPTEDFALFEVGREYTVDPDKFISAAKATPFAYMKADGRCVLTVKDGKIIYKDN